MTPMVRLGQVGETTFNVVPPYEVASWGFIFCRDGEGCRCEIGVRMLQFLSIQVGEKRAKHI